MAPSDLEANAKEAFIDDQFDLALELYTRAIALSPNKPQLFADRAQANIKLERFAEAVADANKAIELDPRIAKAYLRKGMACAKLKEYQTAKSALKIGASLAPDDSRFTKLVKECEEHIEAGYLVDDDQDFGGMFDGYGRIITPFSDEILRTPLPVWYKVPSIRPYDGLQDPQNFLFQYKYSMINQQLNEIHMCRVFPELLVGNARKWFNSLPPSSIGSYRELIKAFHGRFLRFFPIVEAKTTPTHLINIRQGRGESISDFRARFTTESLKIEEIDDLFFIPVFQNSILSGALYKEIDKYEPKTVSDLWRIVDRFAKADEGDRKKTDKKRRKRG